MLIRLKPHILTLLYIYNYRKSCDCVSTHACLVYSKLTKRYHQIRRSVMHIKPALIITGGVAVQSFERVHNWASTQ